uniref:NADH-ubiquinone oxidoreductase chain 3 n=1 Tax=Bothriometopus macrocnemis TaxID=475769 RepID=A8VTZ3_9NEOP|nr:NADH dehydrogenase subunit 3 [Bothriometopus macrocnemis]
MTLTMMINWMIFVVSLVSLLVFIAKLFDSHEEESSSGEEFECGMESMHPTHTPMNMQFFMIGILFLIFDIEVVVMLPLIILSWNESAILIIMSMIAAILIIGMWMEIFMGSLYWKIH